MANYADFQCIRAHLDYSEQAKIHARVNGLSLELCEARVTQYLPITFIGYIT